MGQKITKTVTIKRTRKKKKSNPKSKNTIIRKNTKIINHVIKIKGGSIVTLTQTINEKNSTRENFIGPVIQDHT